MALVLDLPATAPAAAGEIAVSGTSTPGVAPRPGSPLIADCTETVIMPSPLPPRPALRRATFASKPTLRHRHHAHPHKKHARPHKKKEHRIHHGKRRPLRHARRHAPRHHDKRRAILHRVTYASPLCAERSTVLNDMLGLPDYAVTQPPVPAEAVAGDVLPTFIALPSVITGPGPVGPAPIVVLPPVGPIFPVGPGPIIIQPPGPPGPPVGPPGPPVTPPVSSAPEPSSWAMMLMGMMLVGGSIRRRALPKAA